MVEYKMKERFERAQGERDRKAISQPSLSRSP